MTKTTKKKTPKTIDPGELLFAWEARDHHPPVRGWLWNTVFYSIMLGIAMYALWERDWITAFTFLLATVIYYFFSNKINMVDHVGIYRYYLQVNKRFYLMRDFEGYWFIYNQQQRVALINFQLKRKSDQKITLQMGDVKPEVFEKVLAVVGLPELEDREERVLDMWIRLLRL